MMEYPYKVKMKYCNWDVEVYIWLLHNVIHTYWARYWLPGESQMDGDTEWIRYEFVNKEDAVAFKLRFE